MKRSSISGSPINDGSRNLMAAGARNRICSARQTLPIAPRSSSSSSRYRSPMI
jgi:hypothetical protein